MKRFKQFIKEAAKSKSPAPRGVIFMNGGKTAIVGVEHTKGPQIDPELKEKIKAIADKHGKYYEGDGGDIAPLTKEWGEKESYQGSWDDAHAASYDKVHPHHLITLFSNGNPEQFDNLTNPSTTLFQHMLNHPHLASYIPNKSFDAKTLTTFLQQASKSNEDPSKSADLLAMTKLPATRENAERFIKTGQELAYPSGKDTNGQAKWLSYPNPAGQMALRLSRERNMSIMTRPGVYFAGSGHINEIQRLADEHKMQYQLHGGELSDT